MAYTGLEATIPLGQFGLLTDVAPSDVPFNAIIQAKNIAMEKGLVEKAPGTLRYNATALSAGIVGLIDYKPEIQKQRKIVATKDGRIYRDIGDRTFAGGTAITTGLGALNARCMFVEGGQETAGRDKKLFFFSDGLNQLKVLAGDGTSFADVSAPAVDWTVARYPKVGVLHRNRLWAFQGQRAYASATGDHEEFTTGFLTQNIFPGEGGEITGAFVFKGRLFAFKNGGFVYYLDDSATDSSTWFWRKISGNFGLSSPHAIMDALDFMIAGNISGSITNYSATDAFGDVEVADLMRQAQMENWLRENTSKAGQEFQHAVYYAEKKLGFFTYRTVYRTYNDMLLVVDANKENLRVYPWIKGKPQCLALYEDNFGILRPMYGDDDGYLNLMDYEDRLEGPDAYEGSFQTPHLDMRFIQPGFAWAQKHFDHLAIEFPPEGNWNVSVDYFIDGKYIDTLSFEQQLAGEYLDQFLLDTDRLSQAHSLTVTRPLRGTGRRISFKFYNSGSNQSFRIASYTVGFRASGQQATKL